MKRERTQEIPAPAGCQAHVIERRDAVGNWFPLSYMVRTPDGEWFENLPTLGAVQAVIDASRARPHFRHHQQLDFEDDQLQSKTRS